MLNRSYQRAHQAVREAGGGHQVAADLALRLPWAGIFEPWREFVLVGAVAGTKNVPARTENVPVGPDKAAIRCKKSSRQPSAVSFQLELFPDIDAGKFTAAGKFMGPEKFTRNDRQSGANRFPPLAPIEDVDEDRPLFDLFPEAYL